jgi:hypothetical protein
MRIEDAEFQNFMFKVSMITVVIGISLVAMLGG